MTENRKQEFIRLLEEARQHITIKCGYAPSPIPVGVYQRYLAERWKYFGVDFLAFAFMIRLEPDIVSDSVKTIILNFIRAELAQLVDDHAMKDTVPTACYVVETNPAEGSRLYSREYQRLNLHLVVERLLQLTLVHGAANAVAVFDRCSRSEGAQGVIKDVVLLNGIRLETEVQVFKGVELVPLPPKEISEEVTRYLQGFPHNAFMDLVPSFFGKTLLVMDSPALSIFHEPAPKPMFPEGFEVERLPFEVRKHDVKISNSRERLSFRRCFCQALSLACNSVVQVTHSGWFLEEDKTFNPHHETFSMLRFPTPLHTLIYGNFTVAGEDDIKRATGLYARLVALDSDAREKVELATRRWMKSKVFGSEVDKIIDLGIALEALYVTRRDRIQKQLCHRVPLYLGNDDQSREQIKTKILAMYDCRSAVLHNRGHEKEVEVGNQSVPISTFVERIQHLCRESIMKIIDEGEFPDWETLRQRANRKW